MRNNAALPAALAGDESLFTTLAERRRRELQVHSHPHARLFHDAEDLVQETLLKAWRRRETYQARPSLRAWLYTIATNACLGFLEQNPPSRPLPAATTTTARRRPAPAAPAPPQRLLVEPYPSPPSAHPPAPAAAQPDAAVNAKETIRLA